MKNPDVIIAGLFVVFIQTGGLVLGAYGWWDARQTDLRLEMALTFGFLGCLLGGTVAGAINLVYFGWRTRRSNHPLVLVVRLMVLLALLIGPAMSVYGYRTGLQTPTEDLVSDTQPIELAQSNALLFGLGGLIIGALLGFIIAVPVVSLRQSPNQPDQYVDVSD